MDEKAVDIRAKKITSPCDVEAEKKLLDEIEHSYAALKRCLEKSKGDRSKCQSQVEALWSLRSLKKPNSVTEASTLIRRGSMSDI